MKPDKRTVKLAIVGCGRIARSHAQAMAACPQACRLTATVDKDPSRAAAFAREHGAPDVFTEIDAAADSGAFDAAIVCLPHDQLSSAATTLLSHGRHVLLEKPCGTHAAGYLEAMDTARHSGALLVPAYVRRFRADQETVRAIVSSGELGDLQTITFVLTSRKTALATPWWASAVQAGGFWLPIFGSHDLDEMLDLAGRTPETVYAAYGHHLPDLVEGETDGVLVLRFAGTVLGTLMFSCHADKDLPFGGRLVTGSRGCLHYGDGRLTVNGEERAVATRGNMFIRQLLHFLDALEQGVPEQITALDGYRVLQVIDAACRSAAENRAVALNSD